MKMLIRSSPLLLALLAACARNAPAETSLVESVPVQSRDGAEEVLTPASGTREPVPAESTARSTWGGSETPKPTAAAAPRTPDVIYVPTPQPIVDKMLELAAVKPDDVVYDLGCGDGRIVVQAAKKYGARAYGFDIDPKRVAEARENVRKNKVSELVTIEQKDIFTLDLTPASVVTLYLLPRLNTKLLPQLEKLAPGSRVVSHDYDIAGVVPVQHLTLAPAGEDREHEVYFWTVPFQRQTRLLAPIVPGPNVKPFVR